MMPKIDSGSGGGGTTSDDTDDSGGSTTTSSSPSYSTTVYDPPEPTSNPEPEPEPEPEITTTTDDTMSDYNDTIDLGGSGTGATTGNYDFENNAAGVVDTSDEIQDLGGPQAVLVGSQDAASNLKNTIGDLTGQIRDMESQDEPTVTDNTDQNIPANVPETITQYVPVPQGGDGDGIGTALLVAVIAALAFVFGGN